MELSFAATCLKSPKVTGGKRQEIPHVADSVVSTRPVRNSSSAQIPKHSVPLASKNAGNIEESCTTVKKYVHNPKSTKYPHVFHVVFVFSKEIPGLKSVEISGTFTLWRLVKISELKMSSVEFTTIQPCKYRQEHITIVLPSKQKLKRRKGPKYG